MILFTSNSSHHICAILDLLQTQWHSFPSALIHCSLQSSPQRCPTLDAKTPAQKEVALKNQTKSTVVIQFDKLSMLPRALTDSRSSSLPLGVFTIKMFIILLLLNYRTWHVFSSSFLWWKEQVGSRQQQMSHSQFLNFFFFLDGIIERQLVQPLNSSCAALLHLGAMSKIKIPCKIQVKEELQLNEVLFLPHTQGKKKNVTLTEWHTEYTITKTMCRCMWSHFDTTNC